MSRIRLSPLDRLLAGVDNALAALTTHAIARRPDPAASLPAPELDEAARRDIAGLMRINHSGEICAQALYLGQAALARSAATRTYLLHAADEENDHLAWCEARLRALHARPSATPNNSINANAGNIRLNVIMARPFSLFS